MIPKNSKKCKKSSESKEKVTLVMLQKRVVMDVRIADVGVTTASNTGRNDWYFVPGRRGKQNLFLLSTT